MCREGKRRDSGLKSNKKKKKKSGQKTNTQANGEMREMTVQHKRNVYSDKRTEKNKP